MGCELAVHRPVAYNEALMNVANPLIRSVALALVKEDDPSRVLLVRRPEDDEDFPGTWGLPAASLRRGETFEDGAKRIGFEKLGVGVRVGGPINSGRQDRRGYTLMMRLYGGSLEEPPKDPPVAAAAGPGVTLYAGWRWGDPVELIASARRGSLCSQLLLERTGPAQDPLENRSADA